MAKGQAAKQEAFAKMLEMFPDSFLYNDNKELRINTTEDGNDIQLKVVITCAKTPVSAGEENAIPGASFPEPKETTKTKVVGLSADEAVTEQVVEATEDEKQKISNLMAELGI